MKGHHKGGGLRVPSRPLQGGLLKNRIWISQYKGFGIANVIKPETQLTTEGPMVSKPGYDIQFKKDRMLTPLEQEFARRTFAFKGVKHYGFSNPGDPEPTVMGNIDPVLDRCSIFELDWVPDEYKEAAVNCLENHDLRGTDFAEYIPPKLKAPWKTYDQIKTGQGKNTTWVAEQIVQRVEEIGLDPAEVAEYERLTENRDYVLNALEALLSPDDDTITVAA